MYAHITKMKFWHGTKTGDNDTVVNSFRSTGAASDIVPRFFFKGQKHGFYVWTNPEEAKDYAIHDCKDIKGSPAIVGIDAPVNPHEWDFDYELGLDQVVHAFKLMEPEILQTDFSELEFPGLDMYRTPERMTVGKAKGCDLYFGFTNIIDRKWTIEIKYGSSPRTLLGGAGYFQMIADHLKEQHPQKFHAVLAQLIENASAANMATAFKYTGDAKLPVSEISILEDGDWHPANPLARSQKAVPVTVAGVTL